MLPILLVDDERPILKSLTFALEQDYDVYSCDNGADALVLMRERQISLVLMDLRLGKEDGIVLMRQMLAQNPRAAIIIMTAYSSIENSIEAIRSGAYYFITKPVQTNQLLLLLEKAAGQLDMQDTIHNLEVLIRGELIGDSEQMRDILRLIEQVKDTAASVLITGESGTGKELIAKKLHFSSNRRDRPFIAVNCAALPEALLESELFGYKKGAFTGAVRNEPGLILKADKGTLFLDELGDLDPRLQTKLLRFLQEREVRQLGGGDPVAVDVRLICATNHNLEQAVAAGRFRSDLYYRVNVINISTAPLRERTEDLERLVPYFLKKYSAAYRKPIRRIAPEAMKALSSYQFPGNVRECENILQRAVLLCTSETITAADLRLKIHPDQPQDGSEGSIRVYPHETMKEIERKVLEMVLRSCNNNRRQTAESLGISERSLQYKIKEYNLWTRQ